MSTEDTFETVNTVPTETSSEQSSSNENEIVQQDSNTENTGKPDNTSEASDDATSVNDVVKDVDEDLLKIDKSKQATIRYHKNQRKREKEQAVAAELAEIKQQLKTLTEKQQPVTSQSAYNQTNAQNPNLIWDETLQNWVDPDELITYANNLRNKQSGSSNTQINAQAHPQSNSVRSVGQPTPVQNTQSVNEPVSFAQQAENQFKSISERERREYNTAPNQLTNFESGIKDMYDEGLLTPALINGAALASEKGLETLYEWSQSDLGRDKLKEIKTFYQNPYQQAAEIGRLVKMRDEQRAARSKSHVPQQAQPLTESTSDIQDYFNRDMTTIINDHLKR